MKNSVHWCVRILTAFALLITVAGFAEAQEIERVVNKILNGQKTNAQVTVYGVVEKWERNPADNTIAYVLQDDWGDQATVIGPATADHPETHKRYRVSGYVSFDQANRKYIIMETDRIVIEEPPPPTPPPPPPPNGVNWLIVVLVVAVILVLAALVFVLVKGRVGHETTGFPADAVVTVADKTQKITAAVADQKAVDAGTVKVMPGRFEVVGGTELKEIRFIRPRGIPDHRLEYTFGRLAGDPTKHIQLNDPTVSSNQAKLKYRDGKYVLMNIPDPNDPDRNATVINNEKMKADENRELKEGDSIQMGYVTLHYHEK
jgi:hypothetical protein